MAKPNREKVCDRVGHDPGAESMSEDEIRRECKNYAPQEDPAYEPEHMNEKERKHTGNKDAGLNWPHREAYDIGPSLVEAEAENAADDQQRTEQQAKKTLGKQPKDLEAQVENPKRG